LEKEKKMAHVLTYLPKVETLRKWKDEKQMAYQSVVKRDWVPTGRIDFATRLNGNPQGLINQPNSSCSWKNAELWKASREAKI
jgi:hypothetical protein